MKNIQFDETEQTFLDEKSRPYQGTQVSGAIHFRRYEHGTDISDLTAKFEKEYKSHLQSMRKKYKADAVTNVFSDTYNFEGDPWGTLEEGKLKEGLLFWRVNIFYSSSK